MSDTDLVVGGKEFSSRLIVGTGKYSSMEVMKQAHEASGAQIITVALRRVSLDAAAQRERNTRPLWSAKDSSARRPACGDGGNQYKLDKDSRNRAK